MNLSLGFEHLPRPIVEHMRSWVQPRRDPPGVYHVTEVIYCLRKAWYRRVHPDRVRWDVASLWNLYRGTVFDRLWTPLFEIHQRRYRLTRRGVTLTGTLDFVYDDGGGAVLFDLKMPASVAMKKFTGAGRAYRRQVQIYLAMAHANGELLDVRRASVLMVAADGVVREDVEECSDILEWVWPRVFLLHDAVSRRDPSLLMGPEEPWECGGNSWRCPVDSHFKILCDYNRLNRRNS
ncbi:MAG: PD-(D/E)XK nuclease family protein [Deltaproteobacteria bacterium]|nr:PD-(D/E)XK nuclease family protein [Deltaproteobacteria bacterium]